MSLDPIRGRARTATPVGGGAWRGRVTRFDVDGFPYVEIPRLAAGYEYGPVEALVASFSLGLGDRVLVVFLEGRQDDPVIVGRFGGVSAGGGGTGGVDEALIWMGD